MGTATQTPGGSVVHSKQMEIFSVPSCYATIGRPPGGRGKESGLGANVGRNGSRSNTCIDAPPSRFGWTSIPGGLLRRPYGRRCTRPQLLSQPDTGRDRSPAYLLVNILLPRGAKRFPDCLACECKPKSFGRGLATIPIDGSRHSTSPAGGY